ncbi:hypothetical protein ACS60R_05910 [Streptococcus suis]|uniref:hypothetical protein n=1 Tax=Streptococcus suis TaxID=1307 RepID=UPI000CF598C6|nr:hypothetical protein [Streptococcus suis]NQJ67315.1 hypothetical protein [Streptococcus suis]NQN16458.1 hypothetical protein [Streptococcus suis]HEL2511059.1 hypothetical protein [Streptococcus suis]HEL2737030.1 hypothetical protein [Streptococcus suis]HEM2651500.1 hypothetical protein [Streptococcus suis]
MAFENKKSSISKILQETKQVAGNPRGVDFGGHERTKQYQFSLQPSVREKLNQIASEKGYRSASSFLNELIKNM